MSGADISRRGFLAIGAAVATMPGVASGQAGRTEGPLSGASSPILDAVKFRKIEIAVGATRPFTVSSPIGYSVLTRTEGSAGTVYLPPETVADFRSAAAPEPSP